MNNTMIDTKAVITALKKVKEEKNLSIDKIYNIVAENDPASEVSRTTVARVFRDGSEEQIFKWENTLRPIANAMLDLESFMPSDDNNAKAMKSIMKLKKDIIDELEDKLKDYEDLKAQVSHYEQTLQLLNEQIAYKDSRIDKLLDTNERQSITIERITERLMTCPCRDNSK